MTTGQLYAIYAGAYADELGDAGPAAAGGEATPDDLARPPLVRLVAALGRLDAAEGRPALGRTHFERALRCAALVPGRYRRAGARRPGGVLRSLDAPAGLSVEGPAPS